MPHTRCRHSSTGCMLVWTCQAQLCWLLSLGIHIGGLGEGSLIYPLGIRVFSLLASDSELRWAFLAFSHVNCHLEVNTPVSYVVLDLFLKYSGVAKMIKEFQPYYDLWSTVSDWIKWNESWMNDSLLKIEAEELEKSVNDSVKTMQRCVKQFKDSPGKAQSGERKLVHFSILMWGMSQSALKRDFWDVTCVLETAGKMLAKLFSAFLFLKLWWFTSRYQLDAWSTSLAWKLPGCKSLLCLIHKTALK